MKTRFTKMDAILIVYFIIAIIAVNACSATKKVAISKVDACPSWVAKQ
jgi:hypothetical protein